MSHQRACIYWILQVGAEVDWGGTGKIPCEVGSNLLGQEQMAWSKCEWSKAEHVSMGQVGAKGAVRVQRSGAVQKERCVAKGAVRCKRSGALQKEQCVAKGAVRCKRSGALQKERCVAKGAVRCKRSGALQKERCGAVHMPKGQAGANGAVRVHMERSMRSSGAENKIVCGGRGDHHQKLEFSNKPARLPCYRPDLLSRSAYSCHTTG